MNCILLTVWAWKVAAETTTNVFISKRLTIWIENNNAKYCIWLTIFCMNVLTFRIILFITRIILSMRLFIKEASIIIFLFLIWIFFKALRFSIYLINLFIFDDILLKFRISLNVLKFFENFQIAFLISRKNYFVIVIIIFFFAKSSAKSSDNFCKNYLFWKRICIFFFSKNWLNAATYFWMYCGTSLNSVQNVFFSVFK